MSKRRITRQQATHAQLTSDGTQRAEWQIASLLHELVIEKESSEGSWGFCYSSAHQRIFRRIRGRGSGRRTPSIDEISLEQWC